jgi:uncharacterized protein (TIGR02145 family)
LQTKKTKSKSGVSKKYRNKKSGTNMDNVVIFKETLYTQEVYVRGFKSLFSWTAIIFCLGAISCKNTNPADDGNAVPVDSTGTVTDIDGNVYHTVKIDNQEWTVEDLRVTKFNDGSAIPHVTDDAGWAGLSTPGYCYYDNTTDTDDIKKFGALYNWHTVNTEKLVPAGWHVPTDAEWKTLENYLVLNGYNWDGTTDTSKYNRTGKSLAAKTDWLECADSAYCRNGAIGVDLSGNNRTGFSAIPCGLRNGNGDFNYRSYNGYWWSATENDASEARNCNMNYTSDYLGRNNYGKSCGFSVRLLRNN